MKMQFKNSKEMRLVEIYREVINLNSRLNEYNDDNMKPYLTIPKENLMQWRKDLCNEAKIVLGDTE